MLFPNCWKVRAFAICWHITALQRVKQSTTPYKSRMVWLLLTKKASFIETSNPTIYLLQMMSA